MSKPQNLTIGTIVNNDHGELDAVRREKNGKLYHVGAFGQHFMRTPAAQEFMLEHSHIWGAAGPPAGTPQWIVDNLPCPPGTKVAFTAPAEVQPVEDVPETPSAPQPLAAPTPVAENEPVVGKEDPPNDPTSDADEPASHFF